MSRGMYNHGGSSAVYGLGLIGALFYFLPHAITFQDFLLGIVKSLLWPAFLIFKALEVLRV